MTGRRIVPLVLSLVLSLVLWMAAASAAFGQITITSPSTLPQGYSTLPYTYTFTAYPIVPSSPTTWSVPSTSVANLPTGYSLSPNGTFTGTTSQSGTFTFQVTATAGEFTNTQTFSLTLLNPSITITSAPALPNGFVGQAYSQILVAVSNPAGISWSVSSGALPPGLVLISTAATSTGTISGSPTTPGTYQFVLTAEIAGTTISISQSFTLKVYGGQTTIQTTSLPFAVSGQPYSATLLGGPSGVAWVLTGALPFGITFNENTGVFSGMSTFVGTYPLQLQANFPNYLSTTITLNLYVTGGPLTIPKTTLTPTEQGLLYQTAVVATGGVPPYQWSLGNASVLPLSIGPQTGILTGTLQTAGSFLVPITLSDATGQSIQLNLSLFVATPLSTGTTSLANGSINAAYSQSLLPSGGLSPFTWILVQGAGSLPPGLILSPSGVISGTPTQNGTFRFTVQVTDAGGRTASWPLSISIGVTQLLISTASLPNGQLTVAYSQTLAASGGVSPYAWSLASGALPPGLSLNTNGAIAGTPAGPLGTSTFTIQVTDSSPTPLTVQKAFTINVALTLTITTIGPLPAGTLGVPYSQTVVGVGGTTPYTWSVTSGTLPPGLQLNPATGVISGTPTKTGPNLFTVTLTDAGGLTQQQQLNIAIAAATNPPSITTTSTLSATLGTSFSQTLTATGGTAPYTWSIASGTLPAGLQLSNGVISGTPTTAGTASVTLRVTDSAQQTATTTISIAVNPPLPALTIGTISAKPATQPLVSVSLVSSYPTALSGTVAVSFQSAVGGAPSEVTFFTNAGSFSSLSFNIPAGATTAVFPNPPVLVTGTVAGTITLTATLTTANITPSPTPVTETITIAPSAPVIQSVNFSNTGGSLSVTVNGYSTTREMVSGQFTFAPATGSTLSQSSVTVQLSSAFSTWYQSSASNPWGGQFSLTVPFTVSGTAADVASVSVMLTNTQGASAAVAPQ